PVGDPVGQIQIHGHPVKIVVFKNAFVCKIGAGQIVAGASGSSGYIQMVIVDDAGAHDVVDPVHGLSVPAVFRFHRGDVIVYIFRIGFQSGGPAEIKHLLQVARSVQHADHPFGLLYALIHFETELWFFGGTAFGRDQQYAVGSPRSIDRRGAGVFQDINRCNIVRIKIGKGAVVDNSVHHHEGSVFGRNGVDSAD